MLVVDSVSYNPSFKRVHVDASTLVAPRVEHASTSLDHELFSLGTNAQISRWAIQDLCAKDSDRVIGPLKVGIGPRREYGHQNEERSHGVSWLTHLPISPQSFAPPIHLLSKEADLRPKNHLKNSESTNFS